MPLTYLVCALCAHSFVVCAFNSPICAWNSIRHMVDGGSGGGATHRAFNLRYRLDQMHGYSRAWIVRDEWNRQCRHVTQHTLRWWCEVDVLVHSAAPIRPRCVFILILYRFALVGCHFCYLLPRAWLWCLGSVVVVVRLANMPFYLCILMILCFAHGK